jgi:hypothetical protein
VNASYPAQNLHAGLLRRGDPIAIAKSAQALWLGRGAVFGMGSFSSPAAGLDPWEELQAWFYR